MVDWSETEQKCLKVYKKWLETEYKTYKTDLEFDRNLLNQV